MENGSEFKKILLEMELFEKTLPSLEFLSRKSRKPLLDHFKGQVFRFKSLVEEKEASSRHWDERPSKVQKIEAEILEIYESVKDLKNLVKFAEMEANRHRRELETYKMRLSTAIHLKQELIEEDFEPDGNLDRNVFQMANILAFKGLSHRLSEVEKLMKVLPTTHLLLEVAILNAPYCPEGYKFSKQALLGFMDSKAKKMDISRNKWLACLAYKLKNDD